MNNLCLLQVGLVDALGGLSRAVAIAKQRAGIGKSIVQEALPLKKYNCMKPIIYCIDIASVGLSASPAIGC